MEVEGLSLFNVYPEKSPVVSFGLLKYCGRKSKETYCDWSGEEKRKEGEKWRHLHSETAQDRLRSCRLISPDSDSGSGSDCSVARGGC